MTVVDDFGTPGAMPPQQGDAAIEVPAKKEGFLSTTVGKLVVGGIVLVVVLGAVAAIGVIFFLGRTSESVTGTTPTPQAESTGTAAGSEVESPTVRPEPALEDTFAFRNIFQPTIKVTLTPTDDGTGGSNGTDGSGSTVDVPPDTLFLASVSTVDGEPVAELIWNGQTYVLGEGESIPNSPWEVLSISGDTVVMLFGDSRVTLTVGQGISK